MNMFTGSFPEKDNIIQWCKDDGLSCNDISAKNSNLVWCLEIGKPSVLLYKILNLQDRIYFQTNTVLAPEHVKLLNENASKKGNIVLKIQTIIVQLEANPNFLNNSEKKLERISINKIHFHSSINKADFLEKLVRIQNIQNCILNHLNVELGMGMQAQQQDSTSSENPLAS